MAVAGPGDPAASALQALSKRIHYGKFVAEAKFRANEAAYSALIKARDAEGIMDALTDRAVELKARTAAPGLRPRPYHSPEPQTLSQP